MNERECYIALNMMSDLGPVRVRNLVECLGSIEAIFTATESELARAEKVGATTARKIREQALQVDPAKEIQKAAKYGLRIITTLDDEYPEPLRHIYDPPLALYVKGKLLSEDQRSIAVVGSRRCTHYGKQTADLLSYQMGKAGITVISGLARGIDTAAHQGSLKGGGRTIAVLGSAYDTLYPAENAKLAEQIAESGAVITEYPMGKSADRTTFPYRNRIVSGCSMGILVVEAPPKSGSLITVEVGMQQGKHIFAVPGRIDSPTAKGSNRLLKDGATLVENVEDIIREFEFLSPAEGSDDAPKQQDLFKISLQPEEEKIIEVLTEGECDVDTLARRTKVPVHRISAFLVSLEMKKAIKMLPGRLVSLAVELK